LGKTQTFTPEYHSNFCLRVVNKTNVTFTIDELTLLNRDLKYNFSYKRKEWLKTLALEAETAITKLQVNEENCIRFHVAHNIRQLYKQGDGNKDHN